MREGFFDDVIVEGFLPPNFNQEDSNTRHQIMEISKKGEEPRQPTDHLPKPEK